MPLVVLRRSAFWDALQQLQQQGVVPSDLSQQPSRKVQLAKLFPRFVDESLEVQQQQQPSATTSLSSVTSSNSSNTHHALAVEGGEGHGPRKEFFGLVADSWTNTADKQVCCVVTML